MDQNQIADIIGFIAALIGIISFFPQAYDVYKTKNTKSISLSTFVLLSIVSVLWGTYGILLKAYPLIFVNSVVLIMTTYIVVMKIKYK